MKTKLLITLLLTCQIVSAQFYLNEVMLDPPGTDTPHNFIEIRGSASMAMTNMYVITVEGDGAQNPGDIDEIISLDAYSTGTNGYFVLAQTGNFYTINSNATVVLDLFTGSGGDVESQSHTIMLIQSSTAPSSSDDIDSDDDGTPDGAVYAGWTVLDSVSLLKDNDSSTPNPIAVAYSSVVFLEDNEASTPDVRTPVGATVVVTPGTQFDYAGRIGNSTGSALTNDENTSDWVGADLPSSSTPTTAGEFWIMSSSGSAVRAYPESFEGSELNHIGGPNPSQNTTLGVSTFSKDALNVFPNPAKNILNIDVRNINISSVTVFNIVGSKVIDQKEIANNQLDISSLSNGIYFLKILSDKTSVTKKFIVE